MQDAPRRSNDDSGYNGNDNDDNNNDNYGCDQQRVMQAMLDAGVSTRRGVMCAHREPAYQKEPWRCAAGDTHADGACIALGESEAMTDEGLILPLFAEMTDEDQQIVAAALERAIADENRRLFP